MSESHGQPNSTGDVPSDLPQGYADASGIHEDARRDPDASGIHERTQVSGPLFADEVDEIDANPARSASEPADPDATMVVDRSAWDDYAPQGSEPGRHASGVAATGGVDEPDGPEATQTLSGLGPLTRLPVDHDAPPSYDPAPPSYEPSYEPEARGHDPYGQDPVGGDNYAGVFADPEPQQDHYGGYAVPYEEIDTRRRPGWLVPVLLGAAIVVLVVFAFVIGKILAGGVSGSGGAASDGSSSSDNAYAGAVQPVSVMTAKASCTAPASRDAAGNAVTYGARNVFDGDTTTAWRCDGDGIGQKLTLGIPGGTQVGEVGLIPGYAKTDPTSGEDRYAENNRITKVRWTFDDGSAVTQTFDGSAHDRSMQTMRIPPTTSGTVTIEILGSARGPRNTVAISEVKIGATD